MIKVSRAERVTDSRSVGHGSVATVQTSAEPSGSPSEPDPGLVKVAFAAIYNDYFAFVWRNLRRLGIADEGLRDAAQDVFIVVHRRLSEFDGRERVQPWLYSILRRVASDHRRRVRRKERTDDEQPDSIVDPHEPGPEARAARGEARRLLLKLLGELDEDRRELIMLIDLEGLSVPEAADAVNCNLNTAYSRLRTARQMVQEGFERQLAEARRSRLSIEFSDLHSLYRAAEPEEQPTRADKRAVRAAILGAGIASSALHATTASAKLISLVPGGAKVLTIGQLVVYTGLGAAVGTSLAFVGAATAPREPVVAVASSARAPVKPVQAKPTTPEAAPAPTQDESEPTPEEQAEAVPVAPTKPAPAVQVAS